MNKNFMYIRILKENLLAAMSCSYISKDDQNYIDALEAAINALMILDAEYEEFKKTIPLTDWSVKFDGTYEIGDYKCDNCNYKSNELYTFCPNCGADMRKGGVE